MISGDRKPKYPPTNAFQPATKVKGPQPEAVLRLGNFSRKALQLRLVDIVDFVTTSHYEHQHAHAATVDIDDKANMSFTPLPKAMQLATQALEMLTRIGRCRNGFQEAAHPLLHRAVECVELPARCFAQI